MRRYSVRRIVVTGHGAITPFGNTQQTIEKMFAGQSAIDRLPLEFRICPTRIGGRIQDLKIEDWFKSPEAKKIITRATRPTQLASIAVQQALETAQLLQEDGTLRANLRETTGIYVGTGIGSSELIAKTAIAASGLAARRLSFRNLVREHLATALIALPDASAFLSSVVFKIQGPLDCSIKACATGAGNIRRAAMEIMLEEALVMIAGGTESLSPIDVLVFNAYARDGVLSKRNEDPKKASRPFDIDRDGFVPSEGAGIIVLEELRHAKARGARILAELVGFGETSDAKGTTDPDKNSQVRAMRNALKMAGINPSKVRLIKAHATSTGIGDASELEVIKEVFGRSRDYSIWGPKSKLGHTLGASGAIEAILTIEAMRKGMIPPTINLENPDPAALICQEIHLHSEQCYLSIPRQPKKTEIPYVLCNSFGFGGQNVCLLFKRWQD